MATTVARLEAVLSADTKGFDRDMNKSESKMGSVGKSAMHMGKLAAVAGGAAGIGALAYGLKIGISEFMESQKVMAQTNAVIKSTGRAAHISAKGVSALATSIMRYSGIDDEAIQTGENMLLTFKNIRNEVGKGNDIFNQATTTMVDFSVATGKDAQSSAVLLGKALNDPIKGITALTRVGVTFSDAQKKTIKSLVESGHAMEAQKLILKELNSEFGGSARALGQTLGGQINIVRERFNNWAGDMVAKALPAIKKFITDVTPLFNQFMRFITETVLPAVSSFIGFIRDHMPEIKTQFALMWAAVQPILKNLGDLVVTIVGLIRKHWGTIGPILTTVMTIIRNVLTQIGNVIKLFTAILRGDWSAAWQAVKDIVSTAFKAIGDLFKLWKQTMLALAKEVGSAILHGITAALAAGASLLKDAVVGLFKKVIGWVKDTLGIHSPSSVFHEIGVNMIKGMVNGVGSMGGYLKSAVGRMVSGAVGKVGGVLRGALGGGDTGHLSGQVMRALAWAQTHGWHGTVTSGWRSYAEQSALYQRYLAGGPLAAAPGTSSHESGNAVDVTDVAGFARAMASAPNGSRLFNRLGARDPVHWSVSGYDQGGWLPPGLSLAYNGTGAPERVGGGDNVTFNFPNYVGSKSELMTWVQNASQQFKRRNGRSPF